MGSRVSKSSQTRIIYSTAILELVLEATCTIKNVYCVHKSSSIENLRNFLDNKNKILAQDVSL